MKHSDVSQTAPAKTLYSGQPSIGIVDLSKGLLEELGRVISTHLSPMLRVKEVRFDPLICEFRVICAADETSLGMKTKKGYKLKAGSSLQPKQGTMVNTIERPYMSKIQIPTVQHVLLRLECEPGTELFNASIEALEDIRNSWEEVAKEVGGDPEQSDQYLLAKAALSRLTVLNDIVRGTFEIVRPTKVAPRS